MADTPALERPLPERLQSELPPWPTRTRYRYGVDLYNQSTLRAYVGKTQMGKLEYVTEQEGRRPLFVGRYIKNPAPSAEVTPQEIDFIRGQGMSFVPLYCPAQAHVEAKDAAGRRWGREAAKNAVGLAGTLHIPADVFVYANIEPQWGLTPDWVVGWCEGYGASAREGYGGLYCGMTHLASAGPVVTALKTLDTGSLEMFRTHHVTRPAVWLTFAATGERRTPDTLPRVSPEIGEVDIWQYAIGVVGPGQDANAWGYDRDIASEYAFNHMWAPD